METVLTLRATAREMINLALVYESGEVRDIRGYNLQYGILTMHAIAHRMHNLCMKRNPKTIDDNDSYIESMHMVNDGHSKLFRLENYKRKDVMVKTKKKKGDANE